MWMVVVVVVVYSKMVTIKSKQTKATNYTTQYQIKSNERRELCSTPQTKAKRFSFTCSILY